MIMGIVFLLVGVLGFVLVPGGSGMLLGLFMVNPLHNIVHVLVGLWGLAAWKGMGSTPLMFARGLAILYILLGLLGLLNIASIESIVPLAGYDVWLHLVVGLVAAYFGWVYNPPG